ncbi:MAG: type I methionyl aminopeptidase [Gammaproteobacteria bacterium]|jgi:methionyl aminopeptidase|nr:type I methionyl aminopeptidase [Gammaproteobacteria bacterium]|tara:strand:+ start:679 stop:1443 length:765 start_codon:yes stop_codon:yes gene_type:complete
MIIYKNSEEIEHVRESALLVSKTLGELKKYIFPGAIPLDLDKIAETYIRDHGGEPGFLGMYGFPNSLCISINEQVVHGIPNNTPLQNGDIISIDCGVLKNNYYGDHAYTFTVGEVEKKVKKLLEVTKESLYRGIEKLKVGNRIGDISSEIQQYTESHGYGVVRELVGHGLGKNLHEEPDIPNFGTENTGPKIENGLVVAIEPMINLGGKDVEQASDGWTIITKDRQPSAHFEHNIAVIDGKPNILSTFDFIEKG